MQRDRTTRGLAGAGVLAGCLLASGSLLASGCQQPAPPPQTRPVPPVVAMSPADYASLKAAYLKANPDARVGRVLDVLPSEKRLAVGDVPTGDFMKGDVVSVVDDKMALVADGMVVDVDPDILYVKYTTPTVGTNREPIKGDLAVRAATPDRNRYR